MQNKFNIMTVDATQSETVRGIPVVFGPRGFWRRLCADLTRGSEPFQSMVSTSYREYVPYLYLLKSHIYGSESLFRTCLSARTATQPSPSAPFLPS
jgi:hypothetical protein